jgi:tripeptidyl-peptidase-1
MRSLSLLLYALSGCAGAYLLRQESLLDLSQWDQSHEADADHVLQMSIALAIQNTDLGVDTLLRISDPDSPDYGQHLSAEDVVRMFRPGPNALPGVMEWLGKYGIEENRVNLSYGGDRLSLELSVQEAAMLLATKFYHQSHRETGQEQIAAQHYFIPKSLAGSIDYIAAASHVPTQKKVRRQQIVLDDKTTTLAPLPLGCLDSTTVPCLRTLYNIPDDVLPHPNSSLGVFEPAWFSWDEEDLDMFFKQWQKSSVGRRPKVEAVNGGYLHKNRTELWWHEEANLDFEYTMALTSPHEVIDVQVGSYEQPGNLDNMLSAFDKYYCDPINPGYKKHPNFYPPGCNTTSCDCGSASAPKVLSISWGWTEAGYSPNYLQRQCLEFLKLGLMGTTTVVSVSDHGTASDRGKFCIDQKSGNGTDGKFSPMFPSSCPWVTTVGGTQMLQSADSAPPVDTTTETVFRKDTVNGSVSSGGGFSNVFSAPPYQVPNVAAYKEKEKSHLDKIQDRFSSTGRGYPDVAVRANEYWITLGGGWRRVSGTSASNPVFASMITLINSERMNAGKGPVGFINPTLYSNPDVLNDVVTGANQGCGVHEAFRATRGWDAVTGLGSPDYERMRRLFMSLP